LGSASTRRLRGAARDPLGADQGAHHLMDLHQAGPSSQWSMIPTMVRSLGYSLLPAASRAAELPTQITQSPGMQPTASTATWRVCRRAPPAGACARTQGSGWWTPGASPPGRSSFSVPPTRGGQRAADHLDGRPPGRVTAPCERMQQTGSAASLGYRASRAPWMRSQWATARSRAPGMRRGSRSAPRWDRQAVADVEPAEDLDTHVEVGRPSSTVSGRRSRSGCAAGSPRTRCRPDEALGVPLIRVIGAAVEGAHVVDLGQVVLDQTRHQTHHAIRGRLRGVRPHQLEDPRPRRLGGPGPGSGA
jgi:hypothetical protein